MDNEDRLEILKTEDRRSFARDWGPSLDADLCDWIELIVSPGPSEEAFDRLNTLAWFIIMEWQDIASGDPARYELTPTVVDFQEYIYRLNVFATMGIPYAEWQSLVELLFPTLTRMIASAKIDFKSSECEAVEAHAEKILDRLTEDPDAEYSHRYIDFLNGAM